MKHRITEHDLQLQVLKLASITEIAKAQGLEGNQLLLSANASLKEETGTDVLRTMHVQLVSPDGERILTPTQLGKPYGLSAQKLNAVLAEAGFQEKTEAGWQALPKGKPFAVLCDVNKHQGGRTAVQQLKWKRGVVQYLPLRA
ncbi:hypothetical protein [Stenotrophomonas sp. GZD-301]|uniref:hypothetical protein n=1 Tax=Stenotrophomonas sp. GZD-301 TaxID=3404814 RepID=UPI003BB57F35